MCVAQLMMKMAETTAKLTLPLPDQFGSLFGKYADKDAKMTKGSSFLNSLKLLVLAGGPEHKVLYKVDM